MATKTYFIQNTIDARRFAKSFAKGIAHPVEYAYKYFSSLGLLMDNDVQGQFRRQGASGGPRKIPTDFKWISYNFGQGASYKGTKSFPSSTRFRNGAYRKRPGTDGSATRRFSPKSRLLQASGMFRKSFKITKVTNKELKYQTVHKLGGKIGSYPFRPVLFVTKEDRKRYQLKFKTFIEKGIKF
jgi:hypothetical protein